MLNIQNLLYPTDFSACAEAAFSHVLHLARQRGATVHLMHVAPLFGDDPLRGVFQALLDEQTFYKRLRDEADARMKTLLQTYGDNVRVKQVHSRGRAPGPVILDYAVAEAIDLIVMGTHGWRGVRHLLLGSVTEEVVRKTGCSVLTVRAGRTAASAVQRILAPVDFSAYTDHVLHDAAGLAALYGASLALLHVVDPALYPELFVAPFNERKRMAARIEGEVQQKLQELYRAAEPAVEGSTHVLSGYAPDQIVDFAAASRADLIVMGSHGRTGLDRLLLGSVTGRILGRAPCPVWVVRVPTGASPRAMETEPRPAEATP